MADELWELADRLKAGIELKLAAGWQPTDGTLPKAVETFAELRDAAIMLAEPQRLTREEAGTVVNRLIAMFAPHIDDAARMEIYPQMAALYGEIMAGETCCPGPDRTPPASR